MTTNVFYKGVILREAKVPAEMVSLTTVSDSQFYSVTYSINGVNLGSSKQAELVNDKYRAAAIINLSSFVPGSYTLRARTIPTAGATSGSSNDRGMIIIEGSKPGPTNTGCTDKSILTPMAGQTIKVAGAVIKNKHIKGPLVIVAGANNVTFKNCLIESATVNGGRIINNQAYGLVFEDCEISGLSSAVLVIGYGNYTLRRCNVHSASDGARVGHNVLIEKSWFHDLSRQGTLHPDCTQTTGGKNSILRDNNFDCTGVKDTGETDIGNACCQFGAETSATSNFLVENNWFNGGNYSINIRGDANLSNITVRNNYFGRTYRYGPVVVYTKQADVVVEGNVFEDDGSPIPVQRFA